MTRVMTAVAGLLAAGLLTAAADPPAGGVPLEKKVEKKGSSLFKRKPKPMDAAKPEEKAKAPSAKEAPPPDAERTPPGGPPAEKKMSALDQELVKDLGGDAEAADGDNPLVRAGERMRSVEEHLTRREVTEQTEQLQVKIVEDLDLLLKQAQDRQNNKSSSKQKKQRKQNKPQQQREQLQQEQQQQAAQQRRQQQQQAQEQQYARDSIDGARIGRASKEELSQMRERQGVWGHLPPLERQRMQQRDRETPLPDYQTEIERYFERVGSLGRRR